MNIYEDIRRLTESDESQVTGIDSLLKGNSQFRYMMLSRMKSDCDYYLGYGNRNERDLWAKDEKKQLDYMQKLYDSFPEGEKPEWLTQEELDNYKTRMLDSNEDNGEEYHIKNPTVIEDKLTEEESDTSRLKKLIKDLPDEVMYKGKKYVAYQVMLPDTTGENTAIYYCNPKSMPSGDPQEADDYFFVMAKLNKTDNGYKGVKEISYVEDLTESLDDVNYAIEKINKNLKSLDNNEDIDYEVHADFSDFPRIIRSIDKNSRLKAFMMLYMSNPKISELNSWNLDNLIDYIKETDSYYDKDKKYIDMCISLIK